MGPGWWRSLVVLAGVVVMSTSCAALQQQASNSPEASPSLPAVVTSPSTEPTPSAEPSPSAKPSPSPAKLIIKSAAFHLGEVGVGYSTVTATATGGVKPYKWSISSGALPGGLALSTGGSATGKPTAAGTFAFVIRVSDSAGASAGVSRSIFVFRQIAFTTTSALCSGTYMTGCTVTLKYSGGASSRPKLTVTLGPTTPPLPVGSTFTAKGGVVTVVIAIPACSYPSGHVTLVLIDQSPCTTGFRCTSGPAAVDIALSSGC